MEVANPRVRDRVLQLTVAYVCSDDVFIVLRYLVIINRDHNHKHKTCDFNDINRERERMREEKANSDGSLPVSGAGIPSYGV